jgi:hypothetical protein
MSYRFLVVAAIWFAFSPTGSSTAQESSAKPQTGGMPQPMEVPDLVATRTLLLRSRNADQQPAFDRLYPAPDKWTQGDAAPIFLRMNWEASSRIKALQDLRGQVDLGAPLEKLDLDLIDRSLAINLKEMRRFVYRERANWQYPLHEGPIYDVLLPDVQESRNYSHALLTQARYYLVRGTPAEAEPLICMTTGLARHIAETPITICRLVAIAQSSNAFDVVEELLQTPSAGNYYWDMASLPRPLIDLRTAVQFDWIWRGIPELEDLERLETQQQWERAAGALYRLLELSNEGEQESEALITDWVKISRERLPGRLASTDGELAQRVSSMSDAEVGLRYWMIRYREESERLGNWSMLEPHEALVRLGHEELSLKDRIQDEPLVASLLSDHRAILLAGSRLDQQIAMLRVVEAIRDHLSIHNALPDSLEALRLPVPIDPMTARPFHYEPDSSGEQATLASAVLELPRMHDGHPKTRYGRKYLLKVAR